MTWTGENAASFRQEAIVRADGAVEWSGYILDGWDSVLGG
jgi:hypothetical protein